MRFAVAVRDRLMESSAAYRLWQAPFAEQKLAPVLADPDVRAARRVLDLACGPGTNAHHFEGSYYTGVDINPRYIAEAKGRYNGRFLVADATAAELLDGESFDLILMNSFLHHVPDGAVRRTVERARQLLTDDGHLHVLDLILPAERSVARALARADRGDYARPLSEWRELLSDAFEPLVLAPFDLMTARVSLWKMFHFKGKKRPDDARLRDRGGRAAIAA
jgi:SAM-dependent methyltransferase